MTAPHPAGARYPTDPTGATEAQLAAAGARLHLWPWTPESIASQVQFWAARLIPPGSVLLEPDDVAALRRLLAFVWDTDPEAALPTAAVNRLGALVEPDR